MSDLFGGTIPHPEPQPDPYEGMGQNARRTAKRRELLAAGVHPASGVRTSSAHADKTCGDCAHLWHKRAGNFAGWKCDQAARTRADGLDGPDMVKSWPACSLFEPRKEDE